MANFQDVAISVAPTNELDPSFSDGNYGSPGRGRVIDRHVRTYGAKDWMLPVQAKRRRDSNVAQRSPQKRSASGLPFAIVIRAPPVFGHVIECAEGFIARLQLGRQNAPDRPPPVRVTELLQSDIKRVAPAEIGEEIDV